MQTKREAQEALKRLRNRLKADNSPLAHTRESPKRSLRSAVASEHGSHAATVYGIAAVLLLCVAVAAGIAFWRSADKASAERARSRELQSLVASLRQQTNEEKAGKANSAVLRSLQESQKARDALEESLAWSEKKNEALVAREGASEEQLAEAIATTEQLKEQLATDETDRQTLAKLQQESDAKLHEALVELYQARQASAQVASRPDAHEDANLETNGHGETGATPGSTSEAEARNLFGARDLHIVDVYDVAGDGKTKRTYGRVYYVEKKLLVFYAFDLQNRDNHRLAVFQAWGYREANVGKPLNLGLFAVDDTTANRWVLTVNCPDVLSHIDAVFVTVEPPGGSAAPRGKKVLYANLVGPPNHP